MQWRKLYIQVFEGLVCVCLGGGGGGGMLILDYGGLFHQNVGGFRCMLKRKKIHVTAQKHYCCTILCRLQERSWRKKVWLFMVTVTVV